ncbi:MAG: hypothetical protein H7236_11910 [Gemmatimonadaceae bacterium]|nr:hypothetical protein [Caulobacter sp.]
MKQLADVRQSYDIQKRAAVEAQHHVRADSFGATLRIGGEAAVIEIQNGPSHQNTIAARPRW